MRRQLRQYQSPPRKRRAKNAQSPWRVLNPVALLVPPARAEGSLWRTPHRGGLAAGDGASDRSRTPFGIPASGANRLATRTGRMLVHNHNRKSI